MAIGVIAALQVQAKASAAPYATEGSCDGFPKLRLQTPAGLCVGLVSDQLGFARGVAAIGGDIYVTDMGGWRANHGRLLRLGHDGRDKPVVILTGLNEPNAIVPGPAATLYIGLSGKVIRVDPAATDPAKSVRDIVVGLPTTGRHPLSALAVAPDGSLFVNVGSATDHCEDAEGRPPIATAACPETSASPVRGSILHLTPGDKPVDAHQLEPYARGLRNSMALTVLPSGQLVAAINSRDAISRADPALSDVEFPHETYNRVEAGADYGWPYCYDDNRSSPEYRGYACSEKHAPTRLLPAHAAPLGMLLYQGDKLPGLRGQLVIGYHGYQPAGHRIVAMAIDAGGKATADPHELVGGWDYVAGSNPQGAPVSVFEAGDGSLLITEDHNGTLLRLSRN